VDWEVSGTSSEAHAETSIVWLLVWALILPFSHPVRLLSYGLFALLLLIALTILYPAASVFAPILVSSNFEPPLPEIFLPHNRALAVIVPILSGLTLVVLVCVWQRDIVHRFRDPIGPLLTASFAQLPGHVITSALLAGFLIGFSALIWRGGLVGFGLACLVLAPIYARLAFLGPVIVSQGLQDALSLSWRAAKGQIVGHAMIYSLLGLCWIGTLSLAGTAGVDAALRKQSLFPLLLADCVEVTATFFFVLWIAAVPALIVRRRIVLQGIDGTVFD
jgi:hypothetical protein